jgi:hypothetical protein
VYSARHRDMLRCCNARPPFFRYHQNYQPDFLPYINAGLGQDQSDQPLRRLGVAVLDALSFPGLEVKLAESLVVLQSSAQCTALMSSHVEHSR